MQPLQCFEKGLTPRTECRILVLPTKNGHTAPNVREDIMYNIYRDGQLITSTDNVLGYFHRNHSYSMDHAIRYEGYRVEADYATSLGVQS